jgi:hypothetical protein
VIYSVELGLRSMSDVKPWYTKYNVLAFDMRRIIAAYSKAHPVLDGAVMRKLVEG